MKWSFYNEFLHFIQERVEARSRSGSFTQPLAWKIQTKTVTENWDSKLHLLDLLAYLGATA